MKTTSRLIPKFTDKIETENFVCYLNKDILTATGFIGKAKNPSFYYRFKDIKRMEDYCLNWSLNLDRHFKEKEEQKKKQRELQAGFNISEYLKIGDILQNTWGYEQTNQEFYQIVRFKGTKQIVCRELNKEQNYKEGYSSMSSFVGPVKDSFYNEKELTLTCKATEYSPFFHICNPKSFYYFHFWDGREQYCSWYA